MTAHDSDKYIYISWNDVLASIQHIDKPGLRVYGVPKGGMIAAGFLQHAENVFDPAIADVILDDLVDTGATEALYREEYPAADFITVYRRGADTRWVVFPWERDHPSGMDSIQGNIIRLLQFIGEDPTREGLEGTPNRVIKSYAELFSGYDMQVEDLLTTFKSDGYDQIVLLKDIELFSLCEHHMLPFYGKAHVAYIPDGRVIGISKLARVVDMFARRLQIQERIGQQVTQALMQFLQPKGAACIIEADHMCMRMRGVGKQHSRMVTSSVEGVFMDKPEARQELMSLLK